MKQKICAKCGKSEGQFVGAFCLGCYARNESLFKFKPPLLVQCPKCARWRFGRDWKPASQKELEAFLASKVSSRHEIRRANVEFEPGKHAFARVSLVLDADGNEISMQDSLPVEFEKQLCEDCSLRSGGYHEAIIQIRGPPDKVGKMAAHLRSILEPDTFFAKTENKKEGIDMQVGRKKPAIAAVSRLGMHYTTSNKLVGVKDGKRLLRLTILLRV